MEKAFDSADLKDTRVPLIIPFAAASALGVVALCLGSSLPVVLMCVAGITVSFLPLHLYGRDLYSMVAILFSARYLIIALLLKIGYGQSLDSYLFDAAAAYGWTLVLMVIVTLIVLLARRWDPGKQFFEFATDPPSLRKLALISFSIGVSCLAVIGSRGGGDGEASAGPIMVIAAALVSFIVLGLAAEAIRSVELSGGKKLFSPLLAGMFGFTFLAVIALNQRAFLFDAVLGVALVGIMYRAISPRLIVFGLVFAVIFANFLSPLTLYLRSQRGVGISQFIDIASQTATRMIVDPEFRRTVVETTKFAQTQNFTEDTAFDYFGDRSNIANRLSHVALLDAVLNGVRTRTYVGFPAVEKNLAGVMPGFLGFKKDGVSVGDWLAWHTGLLEPPYTTYIVYSLPMEAYTTWGWIGFLTYPFIFLLPVLVIFSRLSSFRLRAPVSIFLFADMQHALIESTSDGFMNLVMREIVVLAIVLGAIHFVFFRERPPRIARHLVKAALLREPRRVLARRHGN
ncbi:hypothetical protein Msil_0690 [Methylocella silvestris BL2]|uniref:Uncharacterized protein n=1 Tax=Methylocella silvestris (strain DSM 15510 / CIP 108128 / LMG 27833 / NCIMB 13906 / BL2) TaxID=395965 RepID=B8EP73_METSB|nr:hypothetical protein [Methylocella silvestris]ACK49661.1 hypothetical protein Msil_0690 [Methylocella silvestris BL2]